MTLKKKEKEKGTGCGLLMHSLRYPFLSLFFLKSLIADPPYITIYIYIYIYIYKQFHKRKKNYHIVVINLFQHNPLKFFF